MVMIGIYNCSGDSDKYGKEVTLNKKQVGGNQVSPDAVGGNVEFALPFPFNMNGYGTYGYGTPETAVEFPYDYYLELGVSSSDLLRQQPQSSMAPGDEWTQMINAGLVEIYYSSYPDEPARYSMENYIAYESYHAVD